MALESRAPRILFRSSFRNRIFFTSSPRCWFISCSGDSRMNKRFFRRWAGRRKEKCTFMTLFEAIFSCCLLNFSFSHFFFRFLILEAANVHKLRHTRETSIRTFIASTLAIECLPTWMPFDAGVNRMVTQFRNLCSKFHWISNTPRHSFTQNRQTIRPR